MKDATKRSIFRWIHIICGIPILGYVYDSPTEAAQDLYPSQCNGSDTSGTVASACIFNDVTVGNNVVPGEVGTQYQAATGYDLATGLGSVNVFNLVNQWTTVTFNATTTALSLGKHTITHGSALPFRITVTPNNVSGTPTGSVDLEAFIQSTSPTNQIFYGPFALSGGTASDSITNLPGGNYGVGARYAGDATFAPSLAPEGLMNITVAPEPSTTAISVLTADQNGAAVPFTSGPFGSFVYLRADVAGQSGQGHATGFVSFFDNSASLVQGSSLPLNSQGNTATPNGILNFDTGQHAITASYFGDPSFNPSDAAQPLTFTITPGFFVAIPSGQSTVVISKPGFSGAGRPFLIRPASVEVSVSVARACPPNRHACLLLLPSRQMELQRAYLSQLQ